MRRSEGDYSGAVLRPAVGNGRRPWQRGPPLRGVRPRHCRIPSRRQTATADQRRSPASGDDPRCPSRPASPMRVACRPVSFHAADAVFLLWIHGEPFRNMFLTARKRAYIEEQRLRNVSGAFARLKRALDSTAPAACGKSTPDRLALLSGGSPLLGGGLGQMASNERLSNVVAIELSYAVGGGLFLSFLPQRRSPPFSQSFPASRSRELRRSAMTSTLRS
jgi:hypothetical protein